MNREDRAKQFLPFDAMKGLKEAMRERQVQHLRHPMRQMSEEFAEELSRTLAALTEGERISLCYHADGREHELCATLRSANSKRGCLLLENPAIEIAFSQIIHLERVDFANND